MKIEVLSTFLDGKERFEAGDIRTVDDERGARFVANGWAKDTAGRVATGAAGGSADLTIHNSTIGLGDSNG
jgi:hypothetical protein